MTSIRNIRENYYRFAENEMLNAMNNFMPRYYTIKMKWTNYLKSYIANIEIIRNREYE